MTSTDETVLDTRRPRKVRDLVDGLPQPLLRGWLHLVGAVLAVPTGMLIVANASPGRARAGAVVYAIGILTMFSVSAAYHRGRWSPPVRRWMKRADHAAIFVMIAGSYTPICLVAMDGAWATGMLIGVWVAAVLGMIGAFTGIAERRVIGLVAYIGLGWAAVLALPQLWSVLSAPELVLLFLGGVLYTAGAVCLGLRWPNPWPRVFGYHEVWHAAVTAAVAAHVVTISSLV